ncbi:MAG: phosphatase PAP2 family protein, partial [Actinomycetota bacterium]|nr:phosphatase PAP2 family protein [Actinomycetota bacterium]
MFHGFTHAHRHELRVLGASLGLLALLAGAVLLIAAVAHLDLSALREMREPALAPLALAITAIGNTDVIVPLALAGVATLAIMRHWRGAAALGVSIAVTEALVTVLKHTVERPRPPAGDAMTQAAGFSFPSGHAAATAAVFVVLAWLAVRH